MDADWSVEAGADLPGIIVPWSEADSGLKYVDLRINPDAAFALAEVHTHPALGAALLRLNSAESAVFTSKCDFWALSSEELDTLALELACHAPFAFGCGCYLDILLRAPDLFASFAAQEHWMRTLCAALRSAESRRDVWVEFVLRPAHCEDRVGFAMTTYIFAGASSPSAAGSSLDATLSTVAGLLISGPQADPHTGSDADLSRP